MASHSDNSLSPVFLLTLVDAFEGTVLGTLLGDVVAVQVRTPDLIAAGVLAVLGLVTVGFVLFLGTSQDARQYAALQAQGWGDLRLATVVLVQALLIGVLGVALGVAAGLGIVDWVVGDVGPQVRTVARNLGLAALVATAVVALLPALWLRTLPTARILAEE